MVQGKGRSNQAQGMLLSCVASQKMEISVPVFIPEVNISHMVQAQQQSSIENLVCSVEHGRNTDGLSRFKMTMTIR